MVYTQMLFALVFDKVVWNTTPGVGSLVGSTMILGSAIYVALRKGRSDQKVGIEEARSEEEVGLVSGAEGSGRARRCAGNAIEAFPHLRIDG